ncbi:YjzD family protein [Enterococcus plantarum]|uniref:YjzD family protein n=1 Tax=Enterococcus plantarum TaxID=1077675 RepID=UPI001A9093C3|nr:YjzD family protein [Enterococcus plantarum]MBO0421470.1 YjzD family protein [Enterococcus plantarum]MBO0468492.1 YjzD family protein [Enterococcus plantarum]
MRYILVLLWSFLLGQVVGYIGGALNGGSYDFMLTTIMSLITGVIILLIGQFAIPKKETTKSAQ